MGESSSPYVDGRVVSNSYFIGAITPVGRGLIIAGRSSIVPSGEGDGTGRAVDPDEWTPDDEQIVGRAWESTDDDDAESLERVTVAVGVDGPEPLRGTVERQRERIDALTGTVAQLREENEALRERNAALESRLAAVEDRLGVGDGDSAATPADG